MPTSATNAAATTITTTKVTSEAPNKSTAADGNTSSDSSSQGTIDTTSPEPIDPDPPQTDLEHEHPDTKVQSSNASIYASFILLALLSLFLIFCLVMKFRSKNHSKGEGGGRISLTPKPNDPTCYEDKRQFAADKNADETDTTKLPPSQTGGNAA